MMSVDGLMNRRRVQLTGTSTFTVSLPKEWAVRNNIAAGSELLLVEDDDGGIVVRTTPAGAPQKEVVVDLDCFSENGLGALKRSIISKYLAGFSKIYFKSASRISLTKRKAIAGEVSRLMSFEVVEEDEKYVIVQDFFSVDNLSIEQAVKRAYTLTLGMYEDALAALQKKDKGLAQSVITADDDVDRLFFLVRRQLAIALQNSSALKKLNMTVNDCIVFSRVIFFIERIADNVCAIAHNAMHSSNSNEEAKEFYSSLLALNKDALALYKTAVQTLFTHDLGDANKVVEACERFPRVCEELEEKFGRANAVSFNHMLILDKMLSIVEHSSSIAETAIDREK